jgi:hypothetical protein
MFGQEPNSMMSAGGANTKAQPQGGNDPVDAANGRERSVKVGEIDLNRQGGSVNHPYHF